MLKPQESPLPNSLVPVVYDPANVHQVLTRHLIILMKKQMRLLGDVPKVLVIDNSQCLDLEHPEDYPGHRIKTELGLEWSIFDRQRYYEGDPVSGRNRFCIMVGEAGQVVIGAYPVSETPHPRAWDLDPHEDIHSSIFIDPDTGFLVEVADHLNVNYCSAGVADHFNVNYCSAGLVSTPCPAVAPGPYGHQEFVKLPEDIESL